METAILALLTFFLLPSASRASSLPTLKMLCTPNCPACKQMGNVMDELSRTHEGKVATEKINVYDHRDVALQYKIRYVPHLLFQDAAGNVLKEHVGTMSMEDVLKTFKEIGADIA